MRADQMEQLRQEREAFDLEKRLATAWFFLRLRTGYVALFLLITTAVFCLCVIFGIGHFPQKTVDVAICILAVDVLGLAATIIKIVMAPANVMTVKPITRSRSKPK